VRNQNSQHIPALSVTLLVLVCLTWGGNIVSIKITTLALSPLLSAVFRSLGAIAVLWLYAVWRKERIMIPRRDLGHGIMIGIFFGGFFFFLYWGSTLTDASRASILVNANPLWVALGAHFLLTHDRITRRKSVGLICSFLGLTLVFQAKSSTSGSVHWLGDLMELLSGFFWAASVIYIKKYPARRTQLQTLFVQLLFSLPILVLGWLFIEHKGPIALTFVVVANLLYQAVIVGFLSYLVWLYLIRLHPVSRVSAFVFLAPLFGVLMSGLLLGEKLSLLLCAGLALVTSGIYLVNSSPEGHA
jgi:drug/metabolite transporter (DMT)-like permease